MAELSTADEEVQDELTVLLEVWEAEQNNDSFDPEPTLTKLCEIFEAANNEYLMNNPDPMDDNHPIKVMPHCNFGHLLTIIFHNENFLSKLKFAGCPTSARYHTWNSLDILSDEDSTITKQLFKWAESAESRELRAYSFGLLAVAMDTEKVIDHKINNQTLIPIALHRLRTLYDEMTKEYVKRDAQHKLDQKSPLGPTNFVSAFKADKLKQQTNKEVKAINGVIASKNAVEKDRMKSVLDNINNEKLRLRMTIGFNDQNPWDSKDFDSSSCTTTDQKTDGFGRKRRRSDPWVANKEVKRLKLNNCPVDLDLSGQEDQKEKLSSAKPPSPTKDISSPNKIYKEVSTCKPDYLAELNTNDKAVGCSFSNSSWKSTMHPIVVGSTYRLYPLSIEMEQRLILQYLTTICEYQDSLSLVLENRGMDVIQNYLAVNGCRDVRLLFDALRYTSSLLNHRKFAWEFIAARGVEKLLQVNRFSMASTAVATCLTYLAYNADIMEKVCQLSDTILNQMVDYALWLLDHSHEHGRELAAHFFASSLQFRTILDRFDEHDGLRRLYNYIAALAILHKTNEEIENDPTYLSSHIYLKIEHMKRSQSTRHVTGSGNCLELSLLESQCLLLPHHHNWRPIDEMRNLGVFRLMLVLLSKRRKTESVKLVLEVLHLATVSPKIQLDMCETMVIKNAPTQGIGSILEFAEGLWQDDLPPLIQKLALEVLINCTCGPVDRNGGRGLFYKITSIKPNLLPPSVLAQLNANSKSMGQSTSSAFGHIANYWNCAQQNNVIMVLTSLLHTKEPPTDADMLREVACRALNGIVRHDPVRQILGKLSLIAANELNALMQEPVLLEKRQETF
uniref:Uncharacterized protein n=1 Tax=Ditylenchus dipsaci TaxID=166011 RepID=A0A915E2L8_9BILA